MTSQSTNIHKLLSELTKDATSYYIKQDNRLSSETVNGNTIFSKYKLFKGKITDALIEKHINREIELAISIKDANVLVFEYRGNEVYAFKVLLTSLAKYEGVNDIVIVNYDVNSLTILLQLEKHIDKDSLKMRLEKLLEDKLPKEWRVLPLENKPNLANLLYLPHEAFLNFD